MPHHLCHITYEHLCITKWLILLKKKCYVITYAISSCMRFVIYAMSSISVDMSLSDWILLEKKIYIRCYIINHAMSANKNFYLLCHIIIRMPRYLYQDIFINFHYVSNGYCRIRFLIKKKWSEFKKRIILKASKKYRN